METETIFYIKKDKTGLCSKEMYLLYEAQIMPFTKKLICGTTFIDLIPILKKKIDEEKSIEELIKENEILKERIKQLEK